MNYKGFLGIILVLLMTINVRSAASSEINGFKFWFSKLPCVKACKERQKREALRQQQNKEHRRKAAFDTLLKQRIREEEALHWGNDCTSDEEVERIFAEQRDMERGEREWIAELLLNTEKKILRGRSGFHYGSTDQFSLASY